MEEAEWDRLSLVTDCHGNWVSEVGERLPFYSSYPFVRLHVCLYHTPCIISISNSGVIWFYFLKVSQCMSIQEVIENIYTLFHEGKLQGNLTKVNVKILNKKLAKWTQKYIKKTIHHDQAGFIPRTQSCFNFRTQFMEFTTLTNARNKPMWLSEYMQKNIW